ncbi:MAG: hypothetical protein FJ318_04360 [SAR202 cluster bacterium]|nr:hypothetical protein [SAR202 cluster bacterium]
MHSLASYQSDIARAVLDSVQRHDGASYTIEVARGGGARELSAWLGSLLLASHANAGIHLLKIAAGDLGGPLARLGALLSSGEIGDAWSSDDRTARVGRAEARLMHPDELTPALAISPVALIEVTGAQLLPEAFFEQRLLPIARATGATLVLYGQPWTGGSWFETQCLRNRAAQDADGVRRHFRVTWETVAAERADYAAEVARIRERLGGDHPTFATGFELRAVGSSVPLFSAALATPGHFSRAREPRPGTRYVASVAVTRLSLSSGEAFAPSQAVVSIAEQQAGANGTAVARVVEHRWLRTMDAAALGRTLRKLLFGNWGCAAVAARLPSNVDPTSEAALQVAMSPLGFSGVRVTWAKPEALEVSRQALEIHAALPTGRLALYAADGSVERRALAHELHNATLGFRSDGLAEPRLSQGGEGVVDGLLLLSEFLGETVPARALLPLAS